MTSIQFQFTFNDYVHAQKLHARRSVWSRLGYVATRFVVPAIGAVDLLMTVFPMINGVNGGTVILLGLSLLLLSFPALLTLNWKYSYKRTRSDDGQWTFAFDDDVIRTNTSNARSEVQWAAVRSIAEDNHVFLLYIAPAKFFPVPKRACTPEQIEELRQLFGRRIKSSA